MRKIKLDRCELEYCIKDGATKGTIRVNENIEDGSYSVMICADCADLLHVLPNEDLPENTSDILKKHKK